MAGVELTNRYQKKIDKRGGDQTMKDTLEEVVNISIGALSLIKDKFIKEVEKFIEEKEFSEKDKGELKERLLERAGREKEDLRKMISKKAEESLKGLGFVGAEKFEALKDKIKNLEKRIEEMEKK